MRHATAAVRLLASGLAVAAGVLAAPGTASATETAGGAPAAQPQGGATATIGTLKTYGAAVIHGGSGDQEISAGLFEMSVDGGGTLQTYGVDLFTTTQRDAKYHETPWSGTSLGVNKDAGRVRWILQNSYPQVNDLATLARKAGAGAGLTEQDAAAGTQVALWRVSDGAAVDAVDPQAERLADYLQKAARNVPEPRASLSLEGAAVSGRPGELLGPVTVRTDAAAVTVSPPLDAETTGVRVVGKDGEPVTTARDGAELFFDIPADSAAGAAELTVQASTTVPVGRAFVSESRSQTQVLAGSSESTVSARADATWAATGAVPALSAARNCAANGLDLTASNQGDDDFVFELMGQRYTIPVGTARTVTVPLQEDQAYDFTLTTPQGTDSRFAGVLDCRTQGAETGLTTQTLAEPSPATVGGGAPTGSGSGTNLAETGSSNATPLIAGTAIGLVVIGGAVLLLVGRKEHTTEH
ncbi:TQXA domain-containing protein [Streptomyces sp. NPDC058417]|uniref:TQXA domain-containing protein n=1 Tax=unclassified Streptomyces TaxID=2593676 RepID=UPI00365F5DD9